MNRKYYVYKYTFPNGKVYIGQTNTDSFRYNKQSAYKGQVVYNAMRHYKRWESEILEYCEEDQINDLEIHYISLYKANAKKYGYNRTPGGSGNTRPSEETRKLQSEIKLAYYANGGKPNIPTFTKEHRIAQSKRAKNQKNRDISGLIPGQNKKEVDVYEYKTGNYVGRYESIREASRQLDIGDGWKHAASVIAGKRSHTKGYVFKGVI